MATKNEKNVILDIIGGLKANLNSKRAKNEPDYKRAMEEELRRQEQKLKNLRS